MKNDPILIVSDDKAGRWLLERQLQKLRVRTESVFTGPEAVSKSTIYSYRLILMKTTLPVMGGADTTKEIRRLERLMHKRRVPIIAMRGADDMEAGLKEAGFDNQYQTPLSIDDLKEIIENWLPAFEKMVHASNQAEVAVVEAAASGEPKKPDHSGSPANMEKKPTLGETTKTGLGVVSAIIEQNLQIDQTQTVSATRLPVTSGTKNQRISSSDITVEQSAAKE